MLQAFIQEWKVTRNGTKLLNRRCSSILLVFILLYKAFAKWGLIPAGRWLWGQALKLTPSHFITNSNIAELFSSPLVLLTAILLALLYAILAFGEISAILICIKNGYQGKPITLPALFKASFLKVIRVCKPQNWLILLFAAVILPFTNLYTASDFISQLTVPEYIMEVIQTTPLYHAAFWVLTVCLFIVVLRLLFLFNIFIDKSTDFPAAAKESIRLTKRRSFQNFCQVSLWDLRCQLLYGIVPLALLLVLYAFANFLMRNLSGANALYDFMTTNLLLPFLAYITDCLTTFSMYTYITVLYRNAAGDAVAEIPRTLESGKKAMGFRWLIPALYASVLLFSALMLFAASLLVEADPYFAQTLYHPIAVTGHRGYSAVAPENTLPSFEAAIRCGSADYAELDVQQTKDGVVVVTHDSSLLRCTGVAVNVYDIPYAELAALDAGSYFGKAFAGTRLPTLDEVIDLCDGKIKLNIEIKNPATSPSLVEETVRIIQAHQFTDKCVITSLDYASLEKVKQLDARIKTGYILAVGIGCYYDLPAADFFSVASNFVSSAMVDAIHQRGKEVHVWTVDKTEDVDDMISMRVDNIITGNPVLVRQAIHDYAPDLENFVENLAPFDLDHETYDDLDELLADA
ncbi:MAG: glycerophosphoryl diester phosphodiesterase membrane domain-containing protein [Clostridia bacterium]|nr:glycerophosphoryl diester phosphodiesterase membrane domain-containing protein [Clostridia bacterium]